MTRRLAPAFALAMLPMVAAAQSLEGSWHCQGGVPGSFQGVTLETFFDDGTYRSAGTFRIEAGDVTLDLRMETLWAYSFDGDVLTDELRTLLFFDARINGAPAADHPAARAVRRQIETLEPAQAAIVFDGPNIHHRTEATGTGVTCHRAPMPGTDL